MRTFSPLLLSVCAAAALAAHGPGQEITAADSASYARFLTSCAPQIAAMKKEMAAHGETASDQDLRGYFEPIPAQLRDAAQAERVSMTEALRDGASRMRQAMSDPANPDPSDKVVGPTMICFLEMLIAGEAGNPTRLPAPAPEARTAAPSQADRGVEAYRRHCAEEARQVSAVSGVDYLTPQANGIAHMDEVYTNFSSDPEGRRSAKAQFHDAMAAGTEAFYRARLALAACAINFTESAEIGIPPSVMARQWLEERNEVYALDRYLAEAAPPPAPARTPASARTPPPARAPAAAPAVSTAQVIANSGGCLTIDWRGGVQGDPAVLGNVCAYAINVGVCFENATPGSVSEELSCEQSRFISYLLSARRSVTLSATHGIVKTRVCTPPQMPAMWWENGTSLGNCR